MRSAARLLRSHGWVVSIDAASAPGTLNGCCSLPITHGEAMATPGRLLAFGGGTGVQAASGTCIRLASASTAASISRSAADSSPLAAGTVPNASPVGLSMPNWLRNLFPGSKKAPAAASSAPQPIAASAPDGTRQSKDSGDDEDLKVLAELRNMSMDGYVEYCKKMRSGSTPPRPRLPPARMSRGEYRGWVDEARVSFLRMQQHERIGSLITKEEGELILAKREEVLCDRRLMETIADRTGVYIDLEVKDCIEQFLELRQKTERIHRFVTEFGHSLPKTTREQEYALRFMERKEADEKLQAALARRDTAGCPMRLKLPWTGPSALCELTRRPYWECCGRAGASPGQVAQEALPGPSHVPQQTERSEPWVDPERIRVAHRKFKGHIGRKFRKAYIEASKPRIRRGVGHATAFFWKPNE